jgi:hypothetical protein
MGFTPQQRPGRALGLGILAVIVLAAAAFVALNLAG